MIKYNVYLEEAMEIAKAKAVEIFNCEETQTNKLIVANVKTYEIGWLFYFENYYRYKPLQDGSPNDNYYFNVYPIFIDKYDGKHLVMYRRCKGDSVLCLTNDEIINEYINEKYPDYWENKRKEEKQQKREDEQFDEWVKSLPK